MNLEGNSNLASMTNFKLKLVLCCKPPLKPKKCLKKSKGRQIFQIFAEEMSCIENYETKKPGEGVQ